MENYLRFFFQVLFTCFLIFFAVRIIKRLFSDSRIAKQRIQDLTLKSTEEARITSCSYINTSLLQREENPDFIKIYVEEGILYVLFSSYFPISFLNAPHIITKSERTDFYYTYYLVKLHRSINGEVQLKFKSRTRFPFLSYSLTISDMSEEDYNLVESSII